MNTNRVAEIKHQFWLWTSLVLLFRKKASQFLSKIKIILELNSKYMSQAGSNITEVIKWRNGQWSFSKLRKKNSWILLHKVFHLHLPESIHILLSAHQWFSGTLLILSLLIHSESGPASPQSPHWLATFVPIRWKDLAAPPKLSLSWGWNVTGLPFKRRAGYRQRNGIFIFFLN